MSESTGRSTGHVPFHLRIKPRLSRRTGTAFLPVSVRMRMLGFEFIRARVRHFQFLIERWGRAASRSRASLTLEYLLSAVMRGRNTVDFVRHREYLSTVFHRLGRIYPALNIHLQNHLNIDGPTVVAAQAIHPEARSSHRVSHFLEHPLLSGSSPETNVPIEHLSGMRQDLGGRSSSRDGAVDLVARPIPGSTREKLPQRHALGHGRGLRITEAARARRAVMESTVSRRGYRPPGLFLHPRASGTSENTSSRGVFGRHGDDAGHRRATTQEGPMRTNVHSRVNRRVTRQFAPRVVAGTEPATGSSDTAGPDRGGRSPGMDRAVAVGGTGSDLIFIHTMSPGGRGSPQRENVRPTLSAGEQNTRSPDAGFSGQPISFARPRGLVDRPAASGQPVNHQTMTWIVNEVYAQMEDRLRTEQERRGIF